MNDNLHWDQLIVDIWRCGDGEGGDGERYEARIREVGKPVLMLGFCTWAECWIGIGKELASRAGRMAPHEEEAAERS